MLKTLHMTPDYLGSRFVYHDNENKLVLPQIRTDYLEKTFSYRGAQMSRGITITNTTETSSFIHRDQD